MKPLNKTLKVIVEVLAEIRYLDDESLSMANKSIKDDLIVDHEIASSGGYTVKTDGKVLNIKPLTSKIKNNKEIMLDLVNNYKDTNTSTFNVRLKTELSEDEISEILLNGFGELIETINFEIE